MSPVSIAPAISSRFVQLFVEAAFQEVGAENLPCVLEKSNLSPSVIEKDSLKILMANRRLNFCFAPTSAASFLWKRCARNFVADWIWNLGADPEAGEYPGESGT